MRYRVIEDLTAPAAERFVVQSTIYGHSWGNESFHPDQLSAEIHMERLASPRVVAGEGAS